VAPDALLKFQKVQFTSGWKEIPEVDLLVPSANENFSDLDILFISLLWEDWDSLPHGRRHRTQVRGRRNLRNVH
jgi:hypothetical protein